MASILAQVGVALLTKAKRIGAIALLSVAAAPANSALILHFDDFTGGGNQVGAAISSLGLSSTVTGHSSFSVDVASAAWDLVVVDISGLSISSANVSALSTYVAGGGAAIMSYWNLNSDSTLAAVFESSVASSFNSPLSLFDWGLSSELFSAPNSVTSPVTFGPEFLGDNGDRLNAVGGGVAVAGFSSAPSAGQAGVILGNSGRTIVNGFSFDELSGSNGIAFAANQIAFALDLADGEVPVPGTLALLGLGALGFRLRRKA